MANTLCRHFNATPQQMGWSSRPHGYIRGKYKMHFKNGLQEINNDGNKCKLTFKFYLNFHRFSRFSRFLRVLSIVHCFLLQKRSSENFKLFILER